MKLMSTMTPIQIASSVIEKLQEENRIALETLHKSQSNIKNLEHQLLEKEQLIKILQDRLRAGSNSFLEMSNRQKEITIKHLELQIQKLLQENKELEQEINALQSDICAGCETKYFSVPTEKKVAPKSSLKKPVTKNVPGKSTSQSGAESREKMLQRIIEHKDKRIRHLSKEIQKLSQTEKELTNKIYRLTKLIPMSHMPSEILTECLLKEIQSLESQIQLNKGERGKLPHENDVMRFKKFDSDPILTLKGSGITSQNDSAISKKVSEKSSSNLKRKEISYSDFGNVQQENVTLVSNLHKLYNDVSELKQLFASENEKLYQTVTKDSLRNDMLRTQWKEIMSRLNNIAESIQSIITINPDFKQNEPTISNECENIILRLQDRLRDSLELATQYENENAILKENIAKLKDQLTQKKENQIFQSSTIESSEEITSSRTVQKPTHGVDDHQQLKSLLSLKQKQLDAAESHLRTCQNFIEELQRKHLDSDCIPDKKDASTYVNYQVGELPLGALMTKLEVAEKNIKTCEGVIEGLQKVIQNLEEENIRLESDLHMAKFKKVLSEANNNHTACLKSQLRDAEDEMSAINNENKELKTKVHSLEADNLTLQNNLSRVNEELASLQSAAKSKVNSLETDNLTLQNNLVHANEELASLKSASEENFSLQSKLHIAEKRIESLENNITKEQNAVEKLRQENTELKTKLQSIERENVLSKAYEDDVMSLRNNLILKEDEIRNLKESLHAFERKAYEMNHYRKTLRQEIEKLCDILLENTESSKSAANRKAIYKAAALHSAQALLRLDDDYNLQSDNDEQCDALEEMKHQVSVYLTEVSRIHELLTIKEQQRENLLKQYLDMNGQTDVPGFKSSHEVHFQEEAAISEIDSRPLTNSSSSSRGTTLGSSESGIHSADKNVQTEKNQSEHDILICSPSETVLKNVQEELETSKSITTYLLTKCSQLEDLLEKERTEYAKCEKEIEMYKNTIKDLKNQLSVKSNVAKRLNTLIEMMRSKECNDEITVEQLKSEIKWLVNENQKVFEKITATQAELCRCKEENSRIQNDLDSLKRQLINEKYEHAKVNNELKHLRVQISNSQSSTLNDI
ncbi:hypothetical protein HNY73_014171 [Argiope bruennichi]|uniref:Uncharacterized protein n=1 Tax=Argiope bruennichi TaxID=94029 RepID=A0A8T0EP73_ARGBR|nr:hypothetical protein HNY73_014171 [Argiope bruennichi]